MPRWGKKVYWGVTDKFWKYSHRMTGQIFLFIFFFSSGRNTGFGKNVIVIRILFLNEIQSVFL